MNLMIERKDGRLSGIYMDVTGIQNIISKDVVLETPVKVCRVQKKILLSRTPTR